jgi:hypothetical protein
MECKVLSKIFDIDEPVIASNYRTQLLEVLLNSGKTEQVNIEFMEKYCKHSAKPSQIFWRDIPIMRIKCLGSEIDLQIQNDKKNTLYFLLRNLVQLPSVRYISILIQLRLPPWKKLQKFIIVLNRVGNIALIPTENSFSSMELKKLLKNLRIKTKRKLDKEQNLELIDILLPDSKPFHDFKIRF